MLGGRVYQSLAWEASFDGVDLMNEGLFLDQRSHNHSPIVQSEDDYDGLCLSEGVISVLVFSIPGKEIVVWNGLSYQK